MRFALCGEDSLVNFAICTLGDPLPAAADCSFHENGHYGKWRCSHQKNSKEARDG